MKTLWQQFLDFIQPLFDPLLYDEKIKRKHPLTQHIPNKMERFTQRARGAMGLAQQTAEQLKHDSIRPEHMLLALIREVDGMAGSVLKELKVDLKQAEALVVTLSDAGPRIPGANLELSQETKKLLELSVDEARRKGHVYIGTEHLLLALVRQANTVVIQVLKVFGVTPADVQQQVHMEDEKAKGKHSLSAGAQRKVERFTLWARRSLGLAQEAAEELQHDHIGPEHLLLGLICEVDGMAGSVLKELKVDLKQAKALVATYSDAGKRKIGANLGLSEGAKKLLELSVVEARDIGHYDIGTEHLLLALVRLTDSVAIKVLEDLGVTPADVRQQIHQAIGDPAQGIREHPEQSASAVHDPNREQFTPSFQRVRAVSLKEAERLHHAQSGTEHILLALLLEQEGIAAQVLRDYRLDIHKVEALVVSLSEAETRKPDRTVGLSESAQKLRDLAIEEARQLKDLDIGPEHLLLAIGHYEGCTALRILRELGIDIDDLRTRTLKAIGE